MSDFFWGCALEQSPLFLRTKGINVYFVLILKTTHAGALDCVGGVVARNEQVGICQFHKCYWLTNK